MDRNFRVGQWLIQPQLNLIQGPGGDTPVEPKAMDVLVCLVKQAGEVVPKERLMQTVWADTFVTDEVLTNSIWELRKAFHDDAKNPKVIQTVFKKGYRLIAPVSFEEEIIETRLIPQPSQSDPDARSGKGSCLNRSAETEGRQGQPTSHSSIVVLPFLDLSPGKDQEFLCDGLTEEIINALTQLRQLRVVARTSAFQFKGVAQDVRRIGEQLNVETVLEGSLRKHGNRLRITAQVNRVDDGCHVWSETYDRELQDVLVIQEEIAQAIVRTFQIDSAGRSNQPLVRRHTRKLEAYHAYLRGRFFVHKLTVDSIRDGIRHFEQALAIDPYYAAAYAGLADAYGLQAAQNHLPSAAALQKAKPAASKALELDDTLSEAHAALGYVHHFEWDWSNGDRAFRRALELNPGNSIACHWYSHHLTALARHKESLELSQRALDLDPLDLLINYHLAWHYYYSRDFELAIEQFQKTLAMDRTYVRPRLFLGWAYFHVGRSDEAVRELETALSQPEAGTDFLGALGYVCGLCGKRDEARSILERLNAEPRYVSPYFQALVFLGLGEHEEALRWLEIACDERSSHMTYLQVDPKLDNLRRHPRFERLIEKAGARG